MYAKKQSPADRASDSLLIQVPITAESRSIASIHASSSPRLAKGDG